MTESFRRTVLITGAAHRIGRSIALAFARRSWNVAIHYRTSADAAASLVRELQSLGVAAITLEADLSVADQAVELIPRCTDALGAPVCLVNNASLFARDDLATLSAASWNAHVDSNLRAPVLLAQSFAPAPSSRCARAGRQHHRPEGAAPVARVLLLRGEQGRPVVGDADHGAGIGTAYPRQCGGAGAGAAEHPPDPAGLRGGDRRNDPEARREVPRRSPPRSISSGMRRRSPGR